ncbi:hypothetical protein B551_0216945 [Cupriavidus sp. HPC(L)]|uniref:hypothetical protein n=1 Tax=Cupriavidus sp. HPC(L) TaxID=1217418 RepID=UPI000291421A|nr:hypothetical protein [Cupriavidus sp. HPC(L)]ESJ06862.1 hypothetical protein B551_0216945 [Cupriavidus sp. HPC(L)]
MNRNTDRNTDQNTDRNGNGRSGDQDDARDKLRARDDGANDNTTSSAEAQREQEVREEARAIPSSLDPDTDIEPIDSDMNLEGLPEQEQDYPHDNRTEALLPEEQIGERIEDAAEGIAPDTPADRADQTDRREERPPRRDTE